MTDRFDLKLFLLRFIRRFYMLIIGATIGALLVGGIYLFVQLVVKPVQYRERVVVHQELHYNDKLGQYTYLNGYTWNQILAMDWITEEVSKTLSGSISPSEISGYITAEMLSDTRVVYVYVTTGSYETTDLVFDALVPVLLTIPDKFGELDDMLVIDASDAPQKVNHISDLIRALILGAVLGVFSAAFLLSFYIITDDSVYIPMLFEEKTGITCECLSEGSTDNLNVIAKEMPDLSAYSGPETDIYILSGCRNGKLVQYVLHELDKRGIKMRKVYLVGSVKWIIKGYYACTRFPNPFIK